MRYKAQNELVDISVTTVMTDRKIRNYNKGKQARGY